MNYREKYAVMMYSDSVLDVLSINDKWQVMTIINNKVYASTQQKCAENVAMRNICLDQNDVINMFVFRMRQIDEDVFEISFSRPCAKCKNMLRAIG
jgi:cytidine deaminase